MIDTQFCEPFLDYMRKYVELDDQAVQMIAANAKEVRISKKNNILHEGIPCDKVYLSFLVKHGRTILILQANRLRGHFISIRRPASAKICLPPITGAF